MGAINTDLFASVIRLSSCQLVTDTPCAAAVVILKNKTLNNEIEKKIISMCKNLIINDLNKIPYTNIDAKVILNIVSLYSSIIFLLNRMPLFDKRIKIDDE